MKCDKCGQEVKWIKIPELKIEVETEIHDKEKCLKDIQIPKGCRLLTTNEITFLHNNEKYRKQLHLENTWEFIEQPFELNKEKGYVARFCAYSGVSDLECYGGPQGSDANLGVRWCRSKK